MHRAPHDRRGGIGTSLRPIPRLPHFRRIERPILRVGALDAISRDAVPLAPAGPALTVGERNTGRGGLTG
ncbi:hypothetical protein [Rhodococcus koreensis]|uniref:hypothetical protein n=1 Tax=Rhodococcus koreensis TaxID=99653 RepID=UPI001981E63F|nr:hypothetical protein [Rhodococcus koreensis]QSE84716.1 hypothetical protein JWS14_39205 [Rhodococcus koreensis]